jgi:Hg(II)-responsive transcriptional regulator
MSIGDVATAAGVRTATVRYYERRGLIAKAPRSGAGYRQYGPDTARRLHFIKRAQGIGFTLEEIQELLDLRVGGPAACSVVEAQARKKIAQVERKLRELVRMRDVLEGLATKCHSHLPTDDCPILEALSDEEAHG